MIEWQFILNPETDALEIDEPVGWADIAFEIVRDKRNHGISISYSLSEIKLVGEGAEYVKEKYEEFGVDADVKIKITAICDNEEQDEETFQLDFGRYEKSCGEDCHVSIGIEEIGCFLIFNNNFDKKVDLLSDVAFDGTTPLDEYEGLEKEITIPAKAVSLVNRGEAKEDVSYVLSDDIEWPCAGCVNDSWDGYLLPPFPDVISSALGSFQVESFPRLIRGCGGNNHPPYPEDTTLNTTELIGDLECELGQMAIRFNLKGRVIQAINDNTGNPGILLRVKIFRLPVGGDGGDCNSPGDWEELYSSDLIDSRGLNTGTHEFDLGFDMLTPTPIQQGDLFHFGCYFAVNRISQIDSMEILFDGGENFVEFSAGALCEDSTASVFMIYETLARVTESVTNKCLKIRSDYFGRRDSEPDAYEEDGCGALEALTTGLFLRKAEHPTFFTSPKDLLNNLQCIHNTGFGLMKDGQDEILRIEPAEFFYQDELLFDCTDANLVKEAVMPEEIPGTILGGYEKWEIEGINGLDEFNSKREYRLTIRNAKTQVDYRCKFVAGGYPIEITRQQSFADSGAADTKYDNDVFIFCLERETYFYGYTYLYYESNYIVEQGGIDSPANMYDPDTVINFRISPIRNMMRLAKLFLGSYRDHEAADSKIILQSGEGNLLAEGYIPFDDCTPENQVVGESDEIVDDLFEREEDAMPLLRPEKVTFEYPMSLADLKKIRANPYGYILHSCGGIIKKAHIMKIIYKPNAGKASLELRNRYQ